MTATAIETTNFFWHCRVAAMLIDTYPVNAATQAHSRHAIRMATLTSTGKNGVLFASDAAREIKEAAGKDWHKCGLLKEHVVPVSLIHEFVLRDLSRPAADAAAPLDPPSALGVLFQEHPRAWQVARVVREWTHLAWISKDDDLNLRGKSLQKCMPADWDGQDRFARCGACGIAFSKP